MKAHRQLTRRKDSAYCTQRPLETYASTMSSTPPTPFIARLASCAACFTLASAGAPTPSQMLYGRTWIAMSKSCDVQNLQELRSNPLAANGARGVPCCRVSPTPSSRSPWVLPLCSCDTLSWRLQTSPAKRVWPMGTPDGGTLVHAAAYNGCYDIAQMLIVDFGLDPIETAEPGGGMSGQTPYNRCEKAKEESVAAGEAEDRCDTDVWVKMVEEAVDFKAAGEKSAMPLIAKRKKEGLAPKPARRRAPSSGTTEVDEEPSTSEQASQLAKDKKLSPAERKAAMQARIAEKKRKKAEEKKGEL
jgi:hypothetical protein